MCLVALVVPVPTQELRTGCSARSVKYDCIASVLKCQYLLLGKQTIALYALSVAVIDSIHVPTCLQTDAAI